MSHGNDIPIDEDEVDKVILGMRAGQPVRLRQGIFNPSFFVSIGLDIGRYDEWKNDIKTEISGEGTVTLYPVLENLPDIFQGILGEVNGLKKLE